jgi:hypothetical protein
MINRANILKFELFIEDLKYQFRDITSMNIENKNIDIFYDFLCTLLTLGDYVLKDLKEGE